MQVTITLPDWIQEMVAAGDHHFPSTEDRMRLVIALSRANVEHGGGPFGAAVFDEQRGTLIAPGVNLVVPARCSVAHAEMVALMMAQQAVRQYDLGATGMPACQLVSSTEPCAMCLGAIPWSGVRSLVCGARDEDARAIGMDEGAKPADWVAALEQRGIRVTRDVLRAVAAGVLRDYADGGGPIYNARGGDSAAS